MTLKDNEREEMSKLYMEKACETLQEAKDKKEQYPNSSITRAYYSMFHAAHSAFMADGVVAVKSHEGVNNRFAEIFVKTGRFPKEIFKMMGETERNRYKAEYNPKVRFSTQEAEKYIENAEKFVEAVEKMIARERE